jgi:hypothetical protein
MSASLHHTLLKLLAAQALIARALRNIRVFWVTCYGAQKSGQRGKAEPKTWLRGVPLR